jgi:hypothetical protein
MAVTTQEQEYARLRSYLTPFISGPNTDAVLNALASGSSSYLVNSVAAVNDNLYIATASGIYLDLRLAEANITRPENVGLSDDIFREIGIQVKNRKQVRDLINNLLDAIFGDQLVKATENSANFEPYALADGDTLLINFDQTTTTTITFNTADFENIGAALAQEVADAITESLSSQGLTGTAIAVNNGNGNFVQLVSGTIGPSSSITVFGGAAQNALQFPAPDPAGGNMSTQWTITLQPGGNLRYTWTGGANPQLGRVNPGDYVNIFGGGFASSPNEGSYTIIDSVGGAVGASYFDISNPTGEPGIVVEGVDNAVLFYNPVRMTLASNSQYAAVYEVKNRVLQIFLPASTKVVRRSRIGSAHIHSPPYGTFTLSSNPNSGDTFGIITGVNLIAGSNFVIGPNLATTATNLVAAIDQYSGLVAVSNVGLENVVVTVYNDSLSNTPTITYTGSASIVASGPLGDPISLEPNQQGPYSYDLSQPFTVGSVHTTLAQNLDGNMPRIFNVESSANFPNAPGHLIFGYGSAEQEGPVPYISVPSTTTLLISPIYTIENLHAVGTTVNLIPQNSPVVLGSLGLDYPFYVTDVVAGRVYAEELIQSITATGINVVFTILYPSGIGLGGWQTDHSEITYVWGDTSVIP